MQYLWCLVKVKFVKYMPYIIFRPESSNKGLRCPKNARAYVKCMQARTAAKGNRQAVGMMPTEGAVVPDHHH
ncbi:hypothetical protein P5673_009730 [Acropora cervicornis]|uniref:Uncharacterized protein n=1 Tax=Acropora cervicornis TaxID=6130 RepID=A0AAD9V9Z2_ACRCE|nr:hypothetical protein P5673_009730 [Acropora cervicornis]